ncbi:MAG: dihydrofolate reductase [Pseudomonadota bacterium]|nr:dihydrofolate reductase [Pseudomonadota bacterium]
MHVALVVAMDRQRGIGREGALPWHLPADLAYFKRVTMGKPIIMGRRTYESIGRPLPGRLNVVLTRNPAYTAPGCEVVATPEAALACAAQSGTEEAMVIGGAAVYQAFLGRADRLYVTEVATEVVADTRFPAIDREQWQEIQRTDRAADDRNPFALSFVVFERRSAQKD